MIRCSNDGASGGSAACSWAGSARRLSYRNLAEKKVRGMVFDAFAWPMAASLLSAPVVYPWYSLAPAVRAVGLDVPIIIWTLASCQLTTFGICARLVVHVVPGWIMLLEYGCVAMTAAVILLRRITRRGNRCPTD